MKYINLGLLFNVTKDTRRRTLAAKKERKGTRARARAAHTRLFAAAASMAF